MPMPRSPYFVSLLKILRRIASLLLYFKKFRSCMGTSQYFSISPFWWSCGLLLFFYLLLTLSDAYVLCFEGFPYIAICVWDITLHIKHTRRKLSLLLWKKVAVSLLPLTLLKDKKQEYSTMSLKRNIHTSPRFLMPAVIAIFFFY